MAEPVTSIGTSLTRFEKLAADLGVLRARQAQVEADLLAVARALRAAGVQQRLLGRLMGERAGMKPDASRKWLQRHGVEADIALASAPLGKFVSSAGDEKLSPTTTTRLPPTPSPRSPSGPSPPSGTPNRPTGRTNLRGSEGLDRW